MVICVLMGLAGVELSLSPAAAQTGTPDPFTRITTGEIVADEGLFMGAAWGDYDNDGFIDLFVANFGPSGNVLYRNQGNGTFVKITEASIVQAGAKSHTGIWGDADNDGHEHKPVRLA